MGDGHDRDAPPHGARERGYRGRPWITAPRASSLTDRQMIPQCGVESAPADLSAFSVVRFVRDQLDCPVADFVFAVHDIK